MQQNDTEKFIESDRNKAEQISKLAAIADSLQAENQQLKDKMQQELKNLQKRHEEEVKMQEQEAAESI